MKKKLLLADDSITIQRVVGIIFADEDYQLLTAADGDRAYELALEEKPDLVIADIAMPGKDGFELCRAIKAAESLAATSVLLLPGVFEEFDETRAAEVCADGWLTKPFESQAMIDKVRSLLATPPLRLEVPSPVATPEDDWATTAFDQEWVTPAFEEAAAGGDEETTGAEPVFSTAQEEETTSGEEDNIWSAVSFAEEDLHPAAAAAEDDDLFPEPAGHGEAVSAASDEEDEILAAVGAAAGDAAEESEYAGDFSYLQDENSEPQELSVDTYGDFSFSGEADETEEDADVLELMESDLEEGDVLVEDDETFIDDQADEVAAQSPPATAGFYPTFSETAVVSEEEEILELTENEIVEEEAAEPGESAAVEDGGETLEVEEAAELADEDADAGRLFADDEDEGSVFAAEAEEDAGATADALFDEEVAEPLEVEDVAESEDTARVFTEEAEDDFVSAAETAEDTGESADELFEDEVAQPGDDGNIFAAAFDEEEAEAAESGVSAARVEEQLRALSEEELTALVERVAGPLIEKLAAQLLEKIAWEVVPDLAETMISAEIEKIKQSDR
ncbi:MAG: response regulator [Pelovirga sp.]